MDGDLVVRLVERLGIPLVVLLAVFLLARELVRAVGPAVAAFLTRLTEALAQTRVEHQELRAHVSTEAAQLRDHVTREAAAIRDHLAREADEIEDAIILGREGSAPSTRPRRRAPGG